jgi:hypothetical protein
MAEPVMLMRPKEAETDFKGHLANSSIDYPEGQKLKEALQLVRCGLYPSRKGGELILGLRSLIATMTV